jgi:hypothetical protein
VETTALARSAAVDAAAPLPTTPAPPAADLHVDRPRWLAGYTVVLVVLDGTAMAAATLTAKISWLGINPDSLHIRSFSIPYGALALATVPAWLVILALAGAYDLGPFGSSSGAWTHIVRAGAQLLAVVAVAYYILHLAMLGRGVLAATIPLAVVLTLVGRALARAGLDELRRRGLARRTALVIGSQRGVDAFVRQLDHHPAAGVAIVGLSVIGGDEADAPTDGTAGNRQRTGDGNGHHDGTESAEAPADRAVDLAVGEPVVLGETPDLPESAMPPHPLGVSDALARTGAETLIVTGGLAQGQLRDIAWTLQGTGVQLLVTPTPSDIEGLRSEIRPVAGLPLLYLDR